MKVKIFFKANIEDLEKEVNKWLAEHGKVKIKFAIQSLGYTPSRAESVVISIFYEERIRARIGG